MNLKTFLRCGYTFTPEEYELETKYVVTISALSIIGIVLATSAVYFYIFDYIARVMIILISILLVITTIILARLVGKNNYQKLMYAMSILFSFGIFSSYYLSPTVDPVSTWIIVQLLVSFLVLDLRLGLLITVIYTIFIFTMNDVMEYYSAEYVLLKIIPVVLGLMIIYMIEKKFRSTIVLLEESNNLLEQRVRERTQAIELDKLRLEYQANYDFLTGLPNRNNFHYEIQKWIEKYTNTTNKFAVFFIDLDRFKRVNDSLGHSIGDKVLQIVSKRVQKVIPHRAFFSRISGDEFTLLYKYTHNEDAEKIAQDIINKIKKPIVLDEQSIYIAASIGISIYPDNSVYHADLTKYADISMFEVKKHGGSTYKFYANEMKHRLDGIMHMERELHVALEKEEFVLFYQPQIDSRTGHTIGVEALIRWNHPIYGLSSPNSFIPLAEETGVILILDYYIFKLGMKQIVAWKKRGFNIPRVSFNFSIKHLHEKDFVMKIYSFLKESGCKPSWIELEITESHVMKNVENAIEILESLRALGVSIAIDDFGVGYSSLSYLKSLPVDKLKIDKSFINHLTEKEIDKTICSAIIKIGNTMGLNVIAEGVETEEQKDVLAALDCYHIQGYLYYEALSSTELEEQILNKSVG